MSSWVYLFSKFTTEALLLEVLCICSACAAYAAFWINRKRRLGAVQDAVPSNLVKTYLNELIGQANTIRQQLFGLLADAGVQVPATGGLQGDQLAEALRMLQGQLAKTPAPTAQPAPAATIVSQDPELKSKMAALEAKLTEQAKSLETVIVEKERLLRDLEQTRAAVKGGTALPSAPAADNSGELMKKIQVLEDKLAEYSVIEDDLANLKKLQQENAQLRAALGGKAPPPIAAPTAAPAEAATASQPAASAPPAAPPAAPASAAPAAPVIEPTAAAFENLVDKVEQNMAQPVMPAPTPAAAATAPAAAPAAATAATSPATPAPSQPAAPASSTPEAAPANIQKSDEDLLSEFEKMLDS